MKVLLIYPPITTYGQDKSQVSPIPPLGLAYLGAYLERNGHQVKIIDAVAEGIDNTQKVKNGYRTGLSDTSLLKQIRRFKPHVVGISSMFSAYSKDAYHTADLVKKYDKKVPVVFGGAHANALTNEVLKNKSVDVCVLGEGELTFAELVKRLNNGEDFRDIDGIAYREGRKVVTTKPRELIKDLDTLPFPARHLLPMDIYMEQHKNPYVYHDRHTFMITSRGCPMNCIYCSIHSIWHHRWRARSPQNILEEINLLKNDYQVKEIHFVDDNLTVNKKRASELFGLLIKNKTDIKWTGPNGVAIWTLDKPLLRKMKKSGCYRLTFGIESGSIETQKFIRKNLNLDYAERMISYANKIGLWTLSTFIVGFPYQDAEQIKKSIDFAIKSKTDFATFYVLMPFPATDIWDILAKEKLVDLKDFHEDTGWYLSTRGVDSKHFTNQGIRQQSTFAHKQVMKEQIRRLLFEPRHYLRKIHTLGDLLYTIKLTKQFIFLLTNSLKKGDRVGGAIYRKSVTRE